MGTERRLPKGKAPVRGRPADSKVSVVGDEHVVREVDRAVEMLRDVRVGLLALLRDQILRLHVHDW